MPSPQPPQLPPPKSDPRTLGWLLVLLAAVISLSVALSARRLHEAASGPLAALGPARLVPELARLVEAERGLAALHLLQESQADQVPLDRQVQALRLAARHHLSHGAPLPADSTDSSHQAAVRSSLQAYWAAQDRLLALSRQAAQAAPGAFSPARDQARALLSGESQQAFQRAGASLAGWQAHREQALQSGARPDRAHLRLLLWGWALLLGLAGLHSLRAPGTRPPAAARADGAADEPADGPAAAADTLPAAADDLAHAAARINQLAWQAAVQAARSGQPAVSTQAQVTRLRRCARLAVRAAQDLRAQAVGGPATPADAAGLTNTPHAAARPPATLPATSRTAAGPWATDAEPSGAAQGRPVPTAALDETKPAEPKRHDPP